MPTAPVPVNTLGEQLRSYGGIRQFKVLDDLPKYYMSILISRYYRPNLLSAAGGEPLANISLPLPSPLNDALNVAYDEEDINMVLGTGVNAAMNKINGSNPRPDTENIGSGATIAGMVGSVFGRVPIARDLTDAARAWYGVSPNQFFVILLKGPKYKTFEFQWRFSPKTPTESENLRATLQYLRNAISPGLGAFGAVFRFPRLFSIAFVPNSKYLYKFKPAVCESLTVNYTPAGQPAFYRTGGKTTSGLNAPEGVDVAMRFLELEYWLDGDFNDNNEPFNTRGPPTAPGTDSHLPPPPNPIPLPQNPFDPNPVSP